MTKIHYNIREDGCTLLLLNQLSNADIALLTDTLKTMGYNGWVKAWLKQNDAIQQWFYATEHKQSELLHTMTDRERVLLLFGAIWHSQFANVCRFVFDDPDTQSQKDSYARRAARGSVLVTGLQALADKKIGWPFDVPCPFAGWD